MKKELKKTNYVVVAHYDGERYLDECCLLGWNGREDYYCTDFYGDDITEAEKKTAEALVNANALNFNGEVVEVTFTDNAKKLKEVIKW